MAPDRIRLGHEESFRTAKGQAGLDQHQVRTWKSWHRWVTLAMLAMAFLAVVTADERDRTLHQRGSSSWSSLVTSWQPIGSTSSMVARG